MCARGLLARGNKRVGHDANCHVGSSLATIDHGFAGSPDAAQSVARPRDMVHSLHLCVLNDTQTRWRLCRTVVRSLTTSFSEKPLLLLSGRTRPATGHAPHRS